ncbi:hypothetical protein Q5424_09735 [Conexibacter sp. JD483]|uniref:hypothetical protein n=1 Tax=unclassified Conexibacter TaxID=2627773 RepID=UPI00272111EF|nr:MULTISPECIES: hypothetical protein [unclassified Conexibacter]MDO8198399.1 hypothetical protein [Conexibacter sp. CPCC 205762]MDR9369361.1 hypothetical protein [Conexibacter sp. JD483]
MRINPRFPAPRAARRASAALALAAGTLAVTAAGAFAAPAITVAPTTGLDLASANSLTVNGTGFTSDAVVQATGLYAGVTATVDGSVYADNANAKYIRASGPTADTLLNADGTFSTTVAASRRFTSGATEIDCAVVQCVLRTWRAHANPDATNLLALRPILFALASPGTPAVTVTPSVGLDRDTPTTVTVAGSGFDPNTANGIGFYAAYGPITSSYWTQSSRAFGSVKWVRPNATPSASGEVLNPDGTWRTTLTASPTYTDGDGTTYDCRRITCGVITFAAQGNANRSFDTASPVAFAAEVIPPAVSATPTSGLDRDATTTVTVRGTNFAGGVYAGLSATVNGTVLFGAGQSDFRWIRAGGPTPETTLAGDGSFTTTLPVSPTFRTGDGTVVDCRVTQCAIITWPQHSNPTTASLYTSTPVTFAAEVIPPAVSATPTSGLDRDATTTVTVRGTNFAGGVYAGLSATVNGTVLFGAGQSDFRWIRAGGPTPETTLAGDGSFTTTLPVSPTFRTGDGTVVDCRVTACAIATWPQHSNPTTASLYTSTPVTFAAVVIPPSVQVSPATELNRDGATTVTINGQNYTGGTYVGLTATVDGRVLYGDQSTFHWVRSGGPTPAETLNADGTFTTTIAVTPTFVTEDGVTVDCRVTQCAISSWRQHTIPTPEALYTNTPLAFAAAVIPPPVERRDETPVTPAPPVDRRDPTPTPTVVTPKGTSVKRAVTIAKNGTATVGTIAVGSQAATLAPVKLTIKIGKKRYAASVVVPKKVAAGKKAAVKLKLSKKAIAALKGRSLKVTVKVKVTAGGKTTTITSKATLKGAATKAAKK